MAGSRPGPPELPGRPADPQRCYLPSDLRTWGWAVQLYALRSTGSWGIGDLGDLRALAVDTATTGGVVLINPLHAVAPRPNQEPSPYYASSRCFRNPIYLDVEDACASLGIGDVSALAERGRALNAHRRIDRDEVFRLKMLALEGLWTDLTAVARYDQFRDEMGEPLELFATYMALAERHGAPWRSWPAEYRHPNSPGVSSFRRAESERIGFHAWVQWLVDEQLRRAGEEGSIVGDLAVGVDPEGADAWIWQDSFAQGVTVGAPPDDYNPEGQNWAALAFDPWALAERDLEPLAYTLRCAMRHAAGLRIDHVMSLFRLFWIPEGEPASAGGYVNYPAERMLDVVAAESRRAGCYVIGEDLGTVEPRVREEMAKRDMLSYKLMWFEQDHPSSYPQRCMAAANTHDLPTMAGLWSGEDTRAQIQAGLDPNEGFKNRIVERIQSQIAVERGAPVSEVIDRSYEALAASPAALAMGSIEDVLETTERYNQPGTTGEWNWSTALPATLEKILGSARYAGLKFKLSAR